VIHQFPKHKIRKEKLPTSVGWFFGFYEEPPPVLVLKVKFRMVPVPISHIIGVSGFQVQFWF